MQCFVVLNKECSIFSLSIKKHYFSYIHISHACWEQRDFIMNFILYRGPPRGWYLVVTVRSCTLDGAHRVGGTHAEGSGMTPLVFCTPLCFSPAHRLPLQWTDLCPPHSGAIMDSSSSHASSPICHPLLLAPPLKDVQIPLRPTCRAAASLPCLPDWRLCLPHNPFSSQRPQEPVEM